MLEEKYNGGGVGFFFGASTRLPASDFLSPWLLGSLQFQVSGQRVGQLPVDVFGPFSQARS